MGSRGRFAPPSARLRLICSVLVAAATGCSSQSPRSTELGALAGGALGAGLGAIVGNQVGNSGAGVAIGSAFGALSGAAMGQAFDAQDTALNERQARLDAQEREIAENRRLIAELRERGVDARSSQRGVEIQLPDVLFHFGSSALTPSARGTVAEIARILADNDRRVSVEGHTDAVGTSEFNLRLSRERAEAVASGLERAGVAKKRLSSRGFGETRPVASNETSDGRAKNRRVEVVVLNR